MTDFLTHLFLPLTAAYVLRRELFASPWALSLAVFGVLPDFDKFLLRAGLFHSLVTLVPFCLAVLAIESYWRGDLEYAPVIAALVLSHLVLDFVDGGPVPLLYPLIETGIGLRYPVQIVFGQGPLGVTLEGSLVAPRMHPPNQSNHTYGFIQGYGVANALLFCTIYFGDRWGEFRDNLVQFYDNWQDRLDRLVG